jgi:alanine dehydrogenase
MLLIANDDVDALLTMEDCLEAIEAVYREADEGQAAYRPRATFDMPLGPTGRYTLATMDGVSRAAGLAAVRIRSDFVVRDPERNKEAKYAAAPGNYCGLVLLFDTRNAEPVALLNDGRVQQLRVGATAAVAARRMAREASAVLGVLGSGSQARSHALAYAAVRDLASIRVYSPNAARRRAFVDELGPWLGVPIEPVPTARDAVEGADLVAACTSSLSPVLEAAWLAPGAHVSSVRHRHEVGADLLARADRVVVHAPPGATGYVVGDARATASGDPRPATTPIPRELPTLVDLLAGRCSGRESDREVTYFLNNVGTGIQFVACASIVYRRALETGRGREIPTSWFLQQIPD